MFASLGYSVTVVDLSAKQLELDRRTAEAHGMHIEFIEGDMLDLSDLHGRDFDLVYQPVSACYVPDVATLYREVGRVLRPDGWYDVEHWNPVHVQLAGYGTWDGAGYVLERPQTLGVPVPWIPSGDDHGPECWHFVHRLSDLIGAMCAAGFRIERFAERTHGNETSAPGTLEHIASFAPPFFRVLARRTTTGS